MPPELIVLLIYEIAYKCGLTEAQINECIDAAGDSYQELLRLLKESEKTNDVP